MNLLFTGFKPFLKFSINPSEKIVNLLEINDFNVHKAILPDDFKSLEVIYKELLIKHQPDFILNFGMNAKAFALELETFAINAAKDFLKAPETIDENADLALKTSIDTYALAEQLRKEGIPARSSNHAGDFLCNFVFYKSLEYTKKRGGQALFIHMPYTANLAASIYSSDGHLFPSLSTDVIIRGVEMIVEHVGKGSYVS